MVKRKVQVP